MPVRLERNGVQLAEKMSPKTLLKFQNSFGDICITQPKLNGERCRIEWHGCPAKPAFLSSYGNEFQFLNRISEEIQNFPHLPYDGEIYVHGWPRNRIHSALSRKRNNTNPDTLELQFHIFDYLSADIPQTHRLNRLNDFRSLELPHVRILEDQLKHISLWKAVCDSYLLEGYEGIIIRAMQSLYTPKRTIAMLKFKPTEKEPCTIVGFKEGTGWATGMLGAFEVIRSDGVSFFVGTGPELTKERRITYWHNRKQLLGKTLTVKYGLVKSKEIPDCLVAYELLF